MSEVQRGFKGLVTNISPHDNPPGTMVAQDNLGITTPGVLSGRKGIVPLNYTGFTSAGSGNCICMAKFDRPEAYWIVYVLTTGVVKAIRNGGQLSIRTGLNTSQPVCFARERHGNLLFINGVDRGGRWDGMDAVSDLLGIDAPTSAASCTPTGTSGGATAGNYIITWRWVDDDGIPSNMAPLLTISAADDNSFPITGLYASAQNRCSSSGGNIEIYRTTSDESDVLYRVVATTAGTTSYTDTQTDDAISADTNVNLPFFYDNGNLFANRFVPPPTNKPFMAFFRDRLWFYGNVSYSTGTIEVQVGTPTILRGTGTAWTAQMVGRYVYLAGATSAFLIDSINTGTQQITLHTAAPTTAAGSSYVIRNGPLDQRLLYWSEADEPESVPIAQNVRPLQENVQDHDFETGLVAHDVYLFPLHERHIYAVQFATQPALDASVSLVAERGCVNNRCWIVAAGTLYLLDQLGVYRLIPGPSPSIAPISDPIQNYWRDGTLDFTTSQYWHGEYEPNEKVLRWYVKFTGDSGTRPTRALCYNPLADAWWTEAYIWEIGGACRTMVSGLLRQVVGGQLDTVYLISQGFADGVTTAIRGTATGATGTTLTDSTANFAATVIGAPVVIISGTGKGQIRAITARTTTQLTVATWTTTPDSTSVYLVGGILYNAKTGAMPFKRKIGTQERTAGVVHQPTTNANSFDVRFYLNHNTACETYIAPHDRGDGVVLNANGDATIDMKLSQYAARSGQNSTGYNWLAFNDGMDEQRPSDRFVAIELRGAQGLDRIQFYSVEIVGVD